MSTARVENIGSELRRQHQRIGRGLDGAGIEAGAARMRAARVRACAARTKRCRLQRAAGSRRAARACMASDVIRPVIISHVKYCRS